MKRNKLILAVVLATAVCFTACGGDDPKPAPPALYGGLTVVTIASGTFSMGSPTTEPGRGTSELQHFVTLTKGFKMGKYEITNAQYAKFLNDKGIGVAGTIAMPRAEAVVDGAVQPLVYDSSKPYSGDYNWGIVWDGSKWTPVAGKGNYPVIWVTWYGAKAFAMHVGGRLPTEAEWEYACRAGSTTAYSYGATANGSYMWYKDNNGAEGTATFGTKEVGKKSANAWGLYDMHGNVREWCNDDFRTYTATAVTDPSGATGNYRGMRGGDYNSPDSDCRSARRNGFANVSSYFSMTGFRVVFD